MNIKQEQIPFHLLERVGFQKSRMDTAEKKALLSGNTTAMKPLVFKDATGTEHRVQARLSLFTLPDHKIGVKVHPYRPEIHNDMHLSKQKMDRLLAGGTVNEKVHGHQYLVQLDKATNELRRIRADRISIPSKLPVHPVHPGEEITSLSMEQKKALKEGKTVHIQDIHGQDRTIKLDLMHPKGIIKKSNTQDNRIKNAPSYEQGTNLPATADRHNTMERHEFKMKR